MIRLTSFADYAIVLMSELAKNEDQRASAQELSQVTGIPAPTVSKILNNLGQAKLLQSHRGLKGGFSLSRSASDISVADIIEVIDGPVCLTECASGEDEVNCVFSESCDVRPHWPPINQAVKEALNGITLDFISHKRA